MPSTAAANGEAAESASKAGTNGAKSAPPKLSGPDIREKFLKFYEDRGHARLPSSSLVPEDPTVMLTIAGMLQFKPIFLGQDQRKVPCATTTQKCVRTNDIENVGVTKRHHTFFEMLGNFSFGDYFKLEACKWAWELSTQVFQLPAERVFVSVFEEDDDAYALWRDKVGVPETHIQRMGAEDNFWASGPTGPCGPCSELYYDFHPERGLDGIDLDDDSRFIEFYNLVFMELNRDSDGNTAPLAKKNIDTGLGLERMAQILQQVPNNYECDLIWPIMQEAAKVAGVEYAASDEGTKTALKVIADHIRAVVYLISDRVLPSNVGRGYIVRRLLRRVVLKGRLLGVKDQFAAQVAQVAIDMSTECDPQVSQNERRIKEQIDLEEKRFLKTIAAGETELQKCIAKAKGGDGGGTVSGAAAFQLYDAHGFPLELTVEVAAAAGLQVDEAGFQHEMSQQKARSKEAREDVDMMADAVLSDVADAVGRTTFIGYDHLHLDAAPVLEIVHDGSKVEEVEEGQRASLILAETPFYAESGGQIGDRGHMETEGGASARVLDVVKGAAGQIFVHKVEVTAGCIRKGDQMHAVVDDAFRRRTRANHTATHLLQAALKQVLGDDVTQQGSIVRNDGFRFDFSLPRPMKATEVAETERLLNRWIEEGHQTTTDVMDLKEAKAAGAIAMFGEKYDQNVRVVKVPGVSMELCGGTHVANTSEIGGFKIVSEAGIASGVRRIEAVSGPSLMPYLDGLNRIVQEVAGSLKVGSAEVPERVAAMQKDAMAKDKQIAALKAELALAKALALAPQAREVNGVKVVVENVEGCDAKSLEKAAAALGERLGDASAVFLGTTGADGAKVGLAAAFSPSLVKDKKMSAGKFVGGIAKICGGGGGGKPALAQAGGKLPEKLPEALEAARAQLRDALA